MFYDYYKILDIPNTATLEEIKKAYKIKSIIWHPDKNQGKDTTQEMQTINEAYNILKDSESHQRYDKEYEIFYTSQADSNRYTNQYNTSQDDNYSKQDESDFSYQYQIKDKILKFLIENAKRKLKK